MGGGQFLTGGYFMSRKRLTPGQIIMKLREAEILLSKGLKLGEVCRQLDVSENTYYHWRKEYRGLDAKQAKRRRGCVYSGGSSAASPSRNGRTER